VAPWTDVDPTKIRTRYRVHRIAIRPPHQECRQHVHRVYDFPEGQCHCTPITSDGHGTMLITQILRHPLNDHRRRHTTSPPGRPFLGQHQKNIDIAVNRNGCAAIVTTDRYQAGIWESLDDAFLERGQLIACQQPARLVGLHPIGESAQREVGIHRLRGSGLPGNGESNASVQHDGIVRKDAPIENVVAGRQ